MTMRLPWFMLKKIDSILVVLILIIVSFGLAALYSIALSQDPVDFTNLKKQMIFLALGLILMILFTALDYRFWKSYSRWIYLSSIILLGAVLIFGTTIRGSTGWFVVGSFQFQPIEVVKLFVLIVLAYYLSQASRPWNQTKHLLATFGLLAPLAILSIMQPDLGGAMLFLIVWLGMIAMIGLRRWQWAALLIFCILFAVLGWKFVLEDYQKARVLSLLHREQDVQDEGYAVTQSIIAIGSGQWTGTGLGFGSQSQLKFLPESHTDFIFSVIAEELGFIGVSILLLVVSLFLLRLIVLAKRAPDDFASLYVLGVVVMFFSQMALNVGVTLGLLPVTGVTFPLVSYGGSSFLVSFMMLGIVQSIAVRS